MQILVRLPNWLGDLVMSTAFVRALQQAYPHAAVHVVVKKGIDTVVDYLPGITAKWVFDKAEYRGLKGAWNYGRIVGAQVKPDIFYCLPDSFSSAWMAKATGARVRVGYGKELRNFLLTRCLKKNEKLHRVLQYLYLLEATGANIPSQPAVFLQNQSIKHPNRIIVNVNSEAESRRLPVAKAISIINLLRRQTDAELVLVGSPKEKPHVDAVYKGLAYRDGIVNEAGNTNMKQFIELLGTAPVMLTTDSGPMHLANALGVHTIALEGASDERNTAPFNIAKSTLIRSGTLPCEPCVKNVCRFGEPLCLLNMQDQQIVTAVLQAFNQQQQA
jgi:lipopolysaccharide heptosyltransferase II